MGIVRQVPQILDIPIQGAGLPVACPIAVVGQQPAQGHIVRLVAVDDSPGGELVVLLLAIQRLLDAAVVLLAFLVTLAVLEEDARRVLLPIVAVVGIEVAFVKAELGQQDGVPRQLVIVVQQVYGTFVHQDEEVQVVRLVAQRDESLPLASEVIFTLGEGLEKMTSTVVELRGRMSTMRMSCVASATLPAVVAETACTPPHTSDADNSKAGGSTRQALPDEMVLFMVIIVKRMYRNDKKERDPEHVRIPFP